MSERLTVMDEANTEKGSKINIRQIRLFPALVFLSVVGVAAYLLVFFSNLPEDIYITIIDGLTVFVGLVAAVVLFIAGHKSYKKNPRLAAGWIYISIAQFLYVAGDAAYMILEVFLKETPYPSVADLLYLSFYPIFLIGAFLLSESKTNPTERTKDALDIGVIMLISFLGIFYFYIDPLFRANSMGTPTEVLLSLAYPLGDQIMVWALMRLLFHPSPEQNRGPIWLLIVGSVIMVFTDCIYSYQTLIDTYRSGELLDIGWTIAYIFSILAGALLIDPEGILCRPSDKFKIDVFFKKVESFIQYLPYVWVSLAFGIFIYGNIANFTLERSLVAIIAVLAITLVLTRQVIALGENSKLSGQLKYALDQTLRQADVLTITNQNLELEIIQRKRVQQQLTYDAFHDSLTGLPNRSLFMDRLKGAMDYSKRHKESLFSVLFLDLDSFKNINDSMGHGVGDQLLKIIALRLKSCVRAGDTVARLGGDEFVLLLQDLPNLQSLIQSVKRIQKELSYPVDIQGYKITITPSIGVVKDINSYSEVEEILRDADIAMYHAKAMGKSRYEFFDQQLLVRAVSRMDLENDLRRGLEQKEFQLYYQPIFSLTNNRLAGFEALIRWFHPQRGMVPPNDFINLAEENGLIIPIGQWVLFEACRQLREWQGIYPQDPPLTVSVNISSRQFNQPNFVNEVEEAIYKTGISPSSLKLELTESVCLDESDVTKGIFNRLSSMGIHIEIDDFGTGYSALSYLQHFPLNTLKIDRSFINKISQAEKKSSLVKGIITLARDLGMDTVAEGIETEEQLSILVDLGCLYGQGFLFSKPVDKNTAQKIIVSGMNSSRVN